MPTDMWPPMSEDGRLEYFTGAEFPTRGWCEGCQQTQDVHVRQRKSKGESNVYWHIYECQWCGTETQYSVIWHSNGNSAGHFSIVE